MLDKMCKPQRKLCHSFSMWEVLTYRFPKLYYLGAETCGKAVGSFFSSYTKKAKDVIHFSKYNSKKITTHNSHPFPPCQCHSVFF